MPETAPAEAPPLAPARRVPFGRLGGFPDLFRRYATGEPEALAFFAHDWRSAADRAAAAEAAAELPRDREALADVLREQNAAWGNDGADVTDGIEALRTEDSVAVVTGQQLGLFGGPLYTVYKAATAVRLARQLAEETGRPAVPVFWMAGEDHDWEEVRATTVLRGNDPETVALPPDDERTPVGRRVLGEEVEAALGELEEALRPTEFSPDVLGALRAAYRPGATMREAFGRWMAGLFRETGLVLISPDDVRLKRLAADVFRREIERPGETLDALEAASTRLDAAGFHRQVAPMPGQLFLMEPEGRFTLDPVEGGDAFTLRGLDRRYSRAELLALLDAEPERFSPNVVLRPIVEDRLLPTAAYVAGPGETSYYAQLGGVYELFGVPIPVVYPRASVTIVEGKVQKVLDRHGLGLADFTEGLDALHRRLVLGGDGPDVDAAFGAAARALHEAVNGLKPVAQDVDPTLGKSAEATRAALQKELDGLKARVVRAAKRNEEGVREGLDKAHANLFPAGSPQERVLSPVYLLNKYGPDLAPRIVGGLDLDTAEHQVTEL